MAVRNDYQRMACQLEEAKAVIARLNKLVLCQQQELIGYKAVMAQDKLKYMSLHDSLTGLYNRAFFDETMQSFGMPEYMPVSLIICDLDGLKIVNDCWGHESGDTLIRSAAAVLKKCFRGGDTVARIGGDEFAVLLPNTPADFLPGYYARIKDALAKYNQENPALPLSVSVGYATTGKNITTMEQLFKEADGSMYREKFTRRRSRRMDLINDLYQNSETGRVFKMENITLDGVLALV